MEYRLLFKKSALKALKKLPAPRRRSMIGELNRVAQDPHSVAADWKPLKGARSSLWRLRVGDWRAICEVHESTITLWVIKIGSRGDVYK